MPDAPPLSSLSLPDPSGLPALVPPPRFGSVGFEDYRPQHPSQQEALACAEAFVREAGQPAGFRWFWQSPEAGRGLYLDGGFGVGKTHLLAAAFYAFEGKKAYSSFAELVHLIGVLGMARARAELGGYAFWCLDEFELDDPGNTLIVKTFLAHVFEQGGFVMTTSNTPPEAQGEGRFNARDFQREIQSLAARFEVVGIGGPDYRRRDHWAALLSEAELKKRLEAEAAPNKVRATWDELLEVLGRHHPIRYGALLAPVGTLYVSGARTMETQNDALRFVHFVDRLYDLKVGLRLSGDIALPELFAPSYRNSAYAKKHYRCLSRVTELLEEAPAGVALSR